MKNKKLMLVLLCLMTGTLMAQQPRVTPLMSKDLTDIPGKEVLMITVEYRARRGGPHPPTQCTWRSFTCWRAQS